MPDSAQERTEKPTPRRIQRARSEGKLAKSRELNSLASLIGAVLGLWLGIKLIFDEMRHLMDVLWGNGFQIIRSDELSTFTIAENAARSFFIMIGPTVGLSLIFSIAANYYQNGGLLLLWKPLVRFDFSVLNPVNGLKRLLSLRSLTELAKSIIKFLAVSYALYSVIAGKYNLLIPTTLQEPYDIFKTIGFLTFHLFLRVISIMLVLSYLDLRYQKWQYIKDLMMTKQEVKEEHKQAEGDPRIKSKIRAKQLQIARARMLGQVPESEVVVTNPTHYAVALMYKPEEMEAPKVVAKGVDFMAKKIIKIARQHGVPIVHNPPLARALYRQVPLESTIPVELYKAVAKVLAYVYQQRGKFARKR